MANWVGGRHTHWCMQIDSKATNVCLLVSGCLVVGWTVLVVACLSVAGISVATDNDNVADSLSEEVELISFEVPLAKADVIDNLFAVVASVAVLALDENTRCVDVLSVDSEDDVNPL